MAGSKSEEVDLLCFNDEESSDDEENLELTRENLIWIFSLKGMEFLKKILKIISLGSQISEAKTAQAILDFMQNQSEANKKPIENLLKEISVSFGNCYDMVEGIKCPNQKAIKLEKLISALPKSSDLIGTKWDCLINTFGLETPSFKVLNHIIQHFWSCTILNEPRDRPTRSNNDDDLSTECSTSTESSTSTKSLGNIEFESLRKHAGWAIKRARDSVQSGPAASKIQVSKADDSFCEVSKKNLLDIFKDLGEDVLVQPGKYLFIPNEEVVPVFLYLHSSLEKMVKSNLETDASKDVLKECLEALCEDKCLRDMWYGVLHLGSPEDLSLKASYVLVLQRIVVMFVKSKQQIIREQLQLKPKKQSSSLRQSLKKVTNNKKGKDLKSENEGDVIISKLRMNMAEPLHVVDFLSSVFTMPDTASDVLYKLHGKELSKILKSLGLPGLNGKSKKRQVDLLLRHHRDGKEWKILSPEKVC